MRGRVTIFLTGNIISIEAKSVKESINQLERSINILFENGFIRMVRIFPKIQNIVATVNFEQDLDIKSLALKTPKVTYEPDQFPAAILRTLGNPVCLLFSSGKIVITGSKSEDALRKVVRKFENMLKPFYVG